ncbi:MAG: tRNA preQ1(34) S-adenosylmethionine ribosyltransferase-isomerase QueA [Deltaproteobacteria bacterium]|nr:tRNA preQ1(34) S-adenosylmethionine ribosyltransferase-isomerase QueA [Deltaproteobacteria bacterium]
MTLDDFDYLLPPDLIAQFPAPARDRSRLMVLERSSGAVKHARFSDFPGLLGEGDLLVLNDTRVFPARLMARRDTGGMVEIFLLNYPAGASEVRCMAKPARKVREGESLTLEDGSRIVVRRDGDNLWVRMASAGDLSSVLERVGRVPLPPYIQRENRDLDRMDMERYQTVFARHPGAVAAPTAGLHFDARALAGMESRGVKIRYLTLHVGPGTFRPVRTKDIRDHRMDTEWFNIPEATAEAVNTAKGRGERVIAVGTTVVRTLESSVSRGRALPGEGTTDLFIYPGKNGPGGRFGIVDALLTNFHLPRSTLLMLVCAFAGTEHTIAAYGEAVREGYRFYSYGDAMFIV